jgi:hypothetical protein
MNLKEAIICGHCQEVFNRKKIWQHIKKIHDCDGDLEIIQPMVIPVAFGVDKETSRLLKTTSQGLMDSIKNVKIKE